MYKVLRSKRIDMPDGSILWRNIYKVHQPGAGKGAWYGLARINKMYIRVFTTAPDSKLQEASWQTIKTS